MRVKVGNKWYSSDKQHVAVEFEKQELEYIKTEMDEKSAPKRRFAVGSQVVEGDLINWLRECDDE